MAAQPALLPERRVIAVFDFDGTVTRGDTLFPFLVFVHGWAGFLARLPRALPWLVAMALRVGSSRVDLQACKLEYSIVSPK